MAFAPPERSRIDGRARRVRWPDARAGAPDGAGQPGESILIETDSNRDEFMEALLARRDNGSERKLMKMIEFDENHAATVLKQWIRQGANG